MLTKIVINTTVALVLLSPVAVEAAECLTTVAVTTCGGNPVEERKIRITTVDGEKIKGRTDADGQFSCPVCNEEIEALKVSGADHNRVSQTTVTEETDEGIHAIVTLNICNA